MSTGNVPSELKILDPKGCAGSIPTLGTSLRRSLRLVQSPPTGSAEAFGIGGPALGTIRLAFARSW